MTKQCPYCAEEIRVEAILCKHCGSELGDEIVPMRMIIWAGSPAWPAFLREYVLTALGAVAFAAGIYFATGVESLRTTSGLRALLVATPFVVAMVAFLFITLVRRSIRVRISERSIEVEQGLVSKNIDVIEMRRIIDVRYKQTVLDRLFRVASLELTVKNLDPPVFSIAGLPASREVFEKIRDRLEVVRTVPPDPDKATV